MNLIPTLISLGLAASVSVFYLQNQSDEPNKVNYRAAFSDFEQTALEFAAHTPLQDISVAMPPSHCANLSYDFEGRLPAGTESTIDISGLNCDMATLKISTSDEKDFQALLSAASASGRSYATETDTSATPPTKTLKWTQRLYSRNTFDLGVKAKLKNNYTGNCISCTSSTKAVRGKWSHKPNESWNGCPAPGVRACGETGTRTCSPPLNFGKECPRIDGTLTTASDRTETRDCLGVPKCGAWIQNSTCSTTCLNPGQDPEKWRTCGGPGPCKFNDGKLASSGHTEYCKTPICGIWKKDKAYPCLDMHCVSRKDDEKDPVKRRCTKNDCINDQGTLVKVGTKEMCGLQDCSPFTTINDCPAKKNNCTKFQPKPKKLQCNGAFCKENETRLVRDQIYEEYCPARPCGILSEWSKARYKCVPKGDDKSNFKQTKTRTCTGEFGCKNDSDIFIAKGMHRKTEILEGCPYWGKWSNSGQCTLNKQEKRGKQKQTRECLKDNEKIKKVPAAEHLCLDENLGLPTQEIHCNYQWGKWEKIKKCPDNCVNDNQKSQIYATCDGGNNKAFCKQETTNKIYSDAESITCGDVKPKCGTWGEWSACKFDGNDGYGSCNKKDAIKTRECSGSYCKDPEGITGNKTDTLACYADKCQINIDNNIDKQIIIDWLVEDVNAPLRPSNKDIRIVISKNSYFSAPSSNACAIHSLGYFKKLTIINNGIITGYSGKGGAGAKPASDPDRYFPKPSEEILEELNGEKGEDGGSAICIRQENKEVKKEVNIVNNGIIKGGRAGGGGGAGTCYVIKIFGKSIEEKCLNGGEGGDGSDLYLPSIMKGEDGQKRIEATYVIEAGTGGDGGVLFKESTLQVDEIPREALRGKHGDLIRLPEYNSDIEIFKGVGGGRGANGSPCWVNRKHSDCDLP